MYATCLGSRGSVVFDGVASMNSSPPAVTEPSCYSVLGTPSLRFIPCAYRVSKSLGRWKLGCCSEGVVATSSRNQAQHPLSVR